MKQVLIKKLEHAKDLSLPNYESVAAAGMDIRAAVETPIVLKPGERKLIPTGLQMALPEGYEAQIRPRSGLAIRNGITMLNTPGTIDADYRGEVKVIAINHGLDETDRGEGGCGSTGVS